MSNLRRLHTDHSVYFVTAVTHERRDILQEYGSLLLNSINKMAGENLNRVIAWVIMPDHFHLLVDIPDRSISSLVKSIKQSFSMDYRKISGRSGRVWQLRFWDHIVRDENDLRRHLDYIHFNPVKHGIAGNPFEYQLSSASLFLSRGQYPADWGNLKLDGMDGEFGE